MRARRMISAHLSPDQPAGESDLPSPLAHQAQVRALVGQRLVVPCFHRQVQQPPATGNGNRPRSRTNVSAHTQPSVASVSLIVWHKDNQINEPIFAADVRGVDSLRDARQKINSESLNGRARLIAVADDTEQARTGNPATTNRTGARASTGSARQQISLPALEIDDAQSSDAGTYTCTIEFNKAPTQTHRVTVHLIDPPKNLLIRGDTDDGPQVYYSSLSGPQQQQPHQQARGRANSNSAVVGPYDEDSQVTLVCESEMTGPEQQTSIGWWQLDSVTTVKPGDHQAHLSASPAKGYGADDRLAPMVTQQLLYDLNNAKTVVTMSFVPDDLVSSDEARDYYSSTYDRHYSAMQQYRDYFVMSSQTPQVMLSSGGSDKMGSKEQVGMVLLPFTSRSSDNAANNGQQLRHWRRADSQSVTSAPVHGHLVPMKRLRSTLQLASVNRSHLGAEFMCLASNNNIAPPLNTTVRLDINLRPTEVKIMNKSSLEFRLNQKTVVECHVIGSRPSAQVRWFSGSHELDTDKRKWPGDLSSPSRHTATDNRHQVQELNRDINDLTKINYLTFVPQLSDNKQTLTCSAFNPHFSKSSAKLPASNNNSNRDDPQEGVWLSDTITMDVLYAPRVQLKFGANIKPDSIEIGTGVFMDCEIDANPMTNDLVWHFNGQPIVSNISAGILMSNQSLVVQQVRVEHRGSYQCVARNPLGSTFSQPLMLKPKFQPICDKALTKTKYEVPIGQTVRIDCNVLAEPSNDLSFSWRFNQSHLSDASDRGADQQQQVQPLINEGPGFQVKEGYETNFTHSWIQFTPETRHNYGTLLCSASNAMGKQEQPCIIQVLPSELPNPVFGCFVDSATHKSFNIHCQSHHGRESKYNYVVELYKVSADATTDSNNQLQNDDSDVGGTGSSGGGSSLRDTSSQQRPQGGSAFADNLKHQSLDQIASRGISGEDEDGSDTSGGSLMKQPVKKSVSQLPTFYVTDLDPATNYNAKIYVQNPKGRSSVATYQSARTLSLSDTNQQLNNGRTQLSNKRTQTAASGTGGGGLSDRVFAYLQSNYLADYTRPWVGIALVVLLCSITLVTLSFFVTKLFCRPAAPAGGGGNKRRRGNRNNRCRTSSANKAGAVSGAEEAEDDYGDSTNEKRDGELMMHISTPPNAVRPKGTACATRGPQVTGGGNGSDTSRETNTDSTLVSSPQTATDGSQTTTTNKNTSSESSRYQCNNARTMEQLRVASAMSLPRNHLDRGASSCHRNSLRSNMYPFMTTRQSQGLTANLVPLTVTDLDHQNNNSITPQISIRSGGSDCTASNSNMADFCATAQQSFVTGCQNDAGDCNSDLQGFQNGIIGTEYLQPNGDPVYVISRNSMQRDEQTTNNNEIACDFWSTNPLMAHQRQLSSACGGGESTQVSSTATADLTDPSNSTLTHMGYQSINRCSLLPLDVSAQHHQQQQQQSGAAPVAAVRPQQMPIGILHNSVSIPVALSNHLQQQQQHTCLDQRPRRQLSQEIIGQNICYQATSENPYLTLNTTNGRLSSQPADYYQSQRQFQQLNYHLKDIPPPIDFAHDYTRFKDTYCLDDEQKDAKHHQKQKVKFEQD